jgi:HEPN domain-containing protein
MDLKLSRKEVSKYCRENYNIVSLYDIASKDYIASRCCFYNSLTEQSYILACQAIEKVLKAILLCLNPNENIRKFNNHKLIPLINRIDSIENFGLQKHVKIATKLWETYEMFRYPDNKTNGVYKRYSYGGDDIDLIDSFFLELIELIPIPSEVKFRTGLYASLYEESLIKNVGQQKYWATHQNKILKVKNNELNRKFLIVKNHLYE